MNRLLQSFAKSSLFKGDLDVQFLRASMVIISCRSGTRNDSSTAQNSWCLYKQRPLISWMYPVFGIQRGQLVLGDVWLNG